MKVHPTRRLSKISETHVANLVERVGHSWREAGRDSIGIDGFIEIVRANEATGQVIGVQVKAGRSHLTTRRRSDGAAKRLPYTRRVIRIEDQHVDYFRLCKFPVVVALYDPNSNNVFWGPVGDDTETAVPIPYVLDRFAGKRLARIADHWHANYPTYADPQMPRTTIKAAKVAARSYYEGLRTAGCYSPAFGQVVFTLRGWRHLIRQNAERDKVLRSLELLGAAIRILSKPTPFHMCRKTDAGHFLYKQTARIIHPNRADAIVSVICEKIGDQPCQFLSVYEHGGRSRKSSLQKTTLPVTRR